jgi:UDP-N-acetylglucosamine 2-epimerase (non-hydrolysing)
MSEIDSLKSVLASGKRILLITGHRRENFGEGFLNICEAIKTIATNFPDLALVYPVHLNPNVQAPVYRLLEGLDNVFLVDPVSYVPFVKLMDSAYLVLTDSGGVQEEAPSLGKPVLVMRDVTERQEAVEAGTAILVGTDQEKIVSEVTRLLTNQADWEEMSKTRNPFGDGKAASRIVEFLQCPK